MHNRKTPFVPYNQIDGAGEICIADTYGNDIVTVMRNRRRNRSLFKTLSFMALLVIPKLKLSDKGLFDVLRFECMDLFAP